MRKETKGEMSVAEAGRRGGNITKQRHGPEHFEKIGRRGGEVTKKRGGPGYYQEIGGLGGQRVRELVAAGKAKQKKIGRPRKASL